MNTKSIINLLLKSDEPSIRWKTRVIFFAALCLMAGCTSNNNERAGNAFCMELTATDYDIISQALDHFFAQPLDSLGRVDSSINKSDYYKLFITGDSTKLDPGPIRVYPNRTYSIIDSAGNYLDNREYKIDCSRIYTYPVRSLTAQEFKEVFGRGWGYTKFYEKYPETYCIIHFSRPSYFENKERAIVYMEFYKEPLWARGAYILFRYDNGKWIFIRIDEVWVS